VRRRPDYSGGSRRDEPVPEAAAWNVMAYLLAGILGFGLPGWLLDLWLGTSWLLLVGLLLGMAVALTTVWFRYGTDRS
jgi:F0F1-type ATP synthase assembly protein I